MRSERQAQIRQERLQAREINPERARERDGERERDRDERERERERERARERERERERASEGRVSLIPQN